MSPRDALIDSLAMALIEGALAGLCIGIMVAAWLVH